MDAESGRSSVPNFHPAAAVQLLGYNARSRKAQTQGGLETFAQKRFGRSLSARGRAQRRMETAPRIVALPLMQLARHCPKLRVALSPKTQRGKINASYAHTPLKSADHTQEPRLLPSYYGYVYSAFDYTLFGPLCL